MLHVHLDVFYSIDLEKSMRGLLFYYLMFYILNTVAISRDVIFISCVL